MTETYTPAARVVVVASLLLAIATMTFVTARVAGASASCSTTACAGDGCGVVAALTYSCAAFAVDFTAPPTRVAWAGLIATAPRQTPG